MASITAGTLGSLNAELEATPLQNFGTLSVIVTGTWVGTISFTGSMDGTNFVSVEVNSLNTRARSTSTTANGQFLVTVVGLKSIKATMTAYTSGTASIDFQGASDVRMVRSADVSYNSSGTEVGTFYSPYIAQPALHTSNELINGRLFSACTVVNAASGNVDNTSVLIINPVDNTKTFYFYKIMCNVNVTNVIMLYKLFANPILTSAAKTITNITQTALSTTVTVTTSTAHNGSVGSTVVITGTTNFNGTFTIASVTSATVFTFTRTANLITLTETSGTATVSTSLGTSLIPRSTQLTSSPASSTAVLYTLPTVSSNGTAIIFATQGQNTSMAYLIEEPIVSLAPGQNILITSQPSSNNREIDMTILWSEVSI